MCSWQLSLPAPAAGVGVAAGSCAGRAAPGPVSMVKHCAGAPASPRTIHNTSHIHVKASFCGPDTWMGAALIVVVPAARCTPKRESLYLRGCRRLAAKNAKPPLVPIPASFCASQHGTECAPSARQWRPQQRACRLSAVRAACQCPGALSERHRQGGNARGPRMAVYDPVARRSRHRPRPEHHNAGV